MEPHDPEPALIGGLRVGIVLRDQRLAVVALQRGRLRQAFTLEAQENPAAVLRGELDARRLGVRRVRLALQRKVATVKLLELPPTVDGNLAQMVAFELERHLPFPAEDMVFDFLPLPAGRGEPQRVLLVAAERRTVDRALRLLEEARLAPQAMTVACHDLVALVPRPPRTKHVVWAHLVGDEAEVLFLEGPRLELSRSVPAADDAALADEIAKSLLLLRWEASDELWVSGDRADQFLGSADLAAMGAPATPPPLSPRAGAALAALGEGANGLTLLALAVALGSRRPWLNLLPPALRPRELSPAQLVTAGNLALAALLGIGLLFAHGYQVARHLTRVNAGIHALDPEVKTVERLVAELDRKRELLKALETAQASSLHPLPMLRELSEIVPPDAWLSTLNLDAQGVELTGQATAANQLIPLLEGSQSLERVEFASPVTKGRDKEQFRIKAAWETPVKPSAPAPSRATGAAGPRGAPSR